MSLWLLEFDGPEMIKTLLIALLVIILSIILFYLLWLKSPYFEVPTEYYKVEYQFDKHANFFTKMRVLTNDILNHSYWIKHIGYDGYCYLLFMRKIMITLIIYIIIYTISSIIFFVIENIMNLGYMENKSFNQTASNIYIILMVLILTMLVLIGIKDFRREIQSIYFFYYSAPNQDKGVNFLKLRTILLKGVAKESLDGESVTKKINDIFYEKAIYGKVISTRFLPDYTELYKIECDKRYYEFYNDVIHKYEINSISKFFMSKIIKDNEEHLKYIKKSNRKMRKCLKTQQIVNSGYAFVTFSSFSAISKLIQFSKKKFSFKNICGKKEKNLRISTFIDEEDINWNHCSKEKASMVMKITLKILLFFILIFLTTPAVK